MSTPAMRPQALGGPKFTACDAPLGPCRSADSTLRATRDLSRPRDAYFTNAGGEKS